MSLLMHESEVPPIDPDINRLVAMGLPGEACVDDEVRQSFADFRASETVRDALPAFDRFGRALGGHVNRELAGDPNSYGLGIVDGSDTVNLLRSVTIQTAMKVAIDADSSANPRARTFSAALGHCRHFDSWKWTLLSIKATLDAFTAEGRSLTDRDWDAVNERVRSISQDLAGQYAHSRTMERYMQPLQGALSDMQAAALNSNPALFLDSISYFNRTLVIIQRAMLMSFTSRRARATATPNRAQS